MRYKHSPRLYEQYLRTFLPIIIAFLILISGILVYYQSRILFRERAASESTSNTLIIERVSDYVEGLKMLATYPYLDREMLEILRKDYSGDNMMFERMQDDSNVREKLAANIYHLRTDLNSVLLISEKTGTVYSAMHGNLRADSDYKNSEWYRAIIEAEHRTVCFGLYHNVMTPSYDTLFGVGKSIIDPQTKEILGVVVINVEERYFRRNWEIDGEGNANGVLLIDDKGNSYSSFRDHDDGFVETVFSKAHRGEPYSFAWIQGKPYCILSAKDSASGWTSIRVADITPEWHHLMLIVVVLVLGIVVVYFVLRYFCRRLALRVTRPLDELNRAMRETSEGNFDVRANEGDDEVGMLAQQFNSMSEHISKLITRVRSEERERSNAELLAMQAQINPHFLYNTIQSIKVMADLQGAARLASVLEKLTQFLRSCYGMVDERVTVERECEQTRNYLDLMMYRYANHFSYDFQIDEEIQQALVPRFILQPLAENAILHGINLSRTTGRITIKGMRREEDVVLEVIDNGCGMSEESIADMLSAKPTKQSVLNVGINNVIKRIHMLCGDEYGLTVESVLDEYTRMIIRLPYVAGEKANEGKCAAPQMQKF